MISKNKFEAALVVFLAVGACSTQLSSASTLPTEPLLIGAEPQFVFDTHVVDNHWALKYKREAVRRVFHQAKKHVNNPVMRGDQPSFLWVVRDNQNGLFRMWYQANIRLTDVADDAKGRKFRTAVAYAESADGVRWLKPELNLFDWHKFKPNNIVLGRRDKPQSEACSPCILEIPERDNRGYRYVMLYRNKGPGCADVNGIRLIGSQDGIHWDSKSDTRIAHLHSDHHNTISYDAKLNEYVMYCRPKHVYRASSGPILDTGASRRVARMTSKSLWDDWLPSRSVLRTSRPGEVTSPDDNDPVTNRLLQNGQSEPQTILIPDEIDSQKHFNFFYGMPTRRYAGVYWGFLEPFRMNDFIYTELAVSRDGIKFDRLPGRPKMIEYGAPETWDDEMIFASPSWVEVGDEWWIYYSGWDGPHGTPARLGGVGLATIRKEGFVSMRGPRGGGVLCTRKMRWPGGDLVINATAERGMLRVRVSDAGRKSIKGFDYDDCQVFQEDSVRHVVNWGTRSVSELRGRIIRLEFYLQDADLYTFRAVQDPTPGSAAKQ